MSRPSFKQAPTMRDVARSAAVSIQTVSAVINHRPGISPATTERVLEAVRLLGYRPYKIAQSLRTRQTDTIALFVSDISAPPLGAMASAIENYAHARGYSLVVYNTHNDIQRETDYMQKVVDNWLDGAVIIAIDDHQTSLSALSLANIPVIAVDRLPRDAPTSSVTLDNYKVGKIAAEHLISLGHRTLGIISGPLRLAIGRERKAGFVDSCVALGAKVIPGNYEGDWHTRSGYEAMQTMLTQPTLPSAVFVASDLMAIGALHAIHTSGLSVPGDISIVGVDNIEQAAYTTPALTTIVQPFDEMGKAAVQMLLDMIEGIEPEHSAVVIEPELIVRESTAAARQ